MAEKIINNPSLLPGDLAFELSGNTITAISGHPIAGSGGGTQSDYVYYPDFDETTGNIEFKLGTIYNPPSPIGGWHISGADGARGPQGNPGANGKTPTFQINSENAHWEWKYTDDVAWTDTHVVASGAVGPKGDEGDDGISPTVSTSVIEGGNRVTFTYGAGSSTYIDVMSGTPGVKGADGTDGISPTVSTETIAGGNRVTFTYDTPSKTKYIDVMSGAPGAPGAEGFSPTISTTPITDDPEHPQGGTKVTVTDSTGSEEFKIWNGVDGEGATVNLKDGDGIHITKSSNDYTIGVSANYSAMAVSWVQDQHYLTNIPNTYALKSDVEAASANALSEAESWVNLQNFLTQSDLAGYATETWVGQQGYLTSVPDSYATKTYANDASANALSEAKTWVGQEGYLKSVSVTANGSIEGAGTTNNPLSLKTSAEQALAAVDGKVSKPTDTQGHNYYLWDSMSNLQNHWSNANSFMESWADQWLFDETDPIVTGVKGLSAGISPTQLLSVYEVGIDTTDMVANKQYAFTTNGWAEVDGYLPTSGGTVSGQLVVSGGSNFDQQFLKITRENVNGYGRIGLGQSGPLALKVDDSNGHTTQVNISPNATNDQLVQVQHGGTTAYLIPAQIHQGSYTPSENDGVLHIILES